MNPRTTSTELRRPAPVRARLSFALAIVAFLVALLAAGSASATQPVVAKVAYCSPWINSACSYDAVGCANSPADRALSVSIALLTANPADTPSDALAATTRIEVCQRVDGKEVCPGTSRELIFDRNPKTKKVKVPLSASAVIYKEPASALPTVGTNLLLDWADPASSKAGVFVRVNGQGTWQDAVAAGGACRGWEVVASDPLNDHFRIVAMRRGGIEPFLPVITDICTQGSENRWCDGCPAPSTDACLANDQAEWARQVLMSLDEGQKQLHLQITKGSSPSASPRRGRTAGTPRRTTGNRPGSASARSLETAARGTSEASTGTRRACMRATPP